MLHLITPTPRLRHAVLRGVNGTAQHQGAPGGGGTSLHALTGTPGVPRASYGWLSGCCCNRKSECKSNPTNYWRPASWRATHAPAGKRCGRPGGEQSSELCSVCMLVPCSAMRPSGACVSPRPRGDPRGFAQAPSKMRDGFLAVSDAPAAWEDQTQV